MKKIAKEMIADMPEDVLEEGNKMAEMLAMDIELMCDKITTLYKAVDSSDTPGAFARMVTNMIYNGDEDLAMVASCMVGIYIMQLQGEHSRKQLRQLLLDTVGAEELEQIVQEAKDNVKN